MTYFTFEIQTLWPSFSGGDTFGMTLCYLAGSVQGAAANKDRSTPGLLCDEKAQLPPNFIA